MFPNQGLFRNLFFQPYNDKRNASLQISAKDSKYLVQRLNMERILKNHSGCIKSVHWNDSGSLLLTAGNDKHIVVSNPFLYEVIVDYESKHKTRIGCAKFLPTTDNRTISCSDDGHILNLDLHRQKETEGNFFTCHWLDCSKLETIPGEPHSFLSCSEDGTVRQFDLRSHNKCFNEHCLEHVLIDCVEPVSTIAINPMRPDQLAIATIDGIVRIVDRRKIITRNPACKIVPECSFFVPSLSNQITSLSYSPDGKDMLVSYADRDIYLFSLDAPKPPSYRQISLRGDLAATGPLSRPSTDSEIRTQSEVVAQMVEVDDVPMYKGVTEHTINSVVSDRAVNTVDESLASSNFEPSTSSNNNQRVEKRIEIFKKSQVFDDLVTVQPIKAQYKGHRHGRTFIKEATFWGNNFIMSGSECGHVFVWDRYTCEIVMLLMANSRAVNYIQPHPSLPILATSGVGPKVKLWSPTAGEDNMFSEVSAKELVERNDFVNKDLMELSKFEIIARSRSLVEYLRRNQHERVVDNQNDIQAGSSRNDSNFEQPRFFSESSEEDSSSNSDDSTGGDSSSSTTTNDYSTTTNDYSTTTSDYSTSSSSDESNEEYFF